MADTKELPVFAYIQIEDQLKEIRQYLNRGDMIRLDPNGPADTDENLIEINRELRHLPLFASHSDVDILLNSVCSLLVTVSDQKCEKVILSFVDSVAPKFYKGTGWSSAAGHAVLVLSNLFRSYHSFPKIQLAIYKNLVALCGETRLIGELDVKIETLNRQFEDWSVAVEDRRLILRLVHKALLADNRADQASKIMVALLGTYTAADAQSAREDATECVRTAVVDPSAFSFDHLQRLSAVQALQKSDPLMYSVLELFITGTLSDYQNFVKKNPTFVKQNLKVDEETMLKKIRLLTLMSLAEKNNEIDLDELAKQLGLPNDDSLDEFIIDAIQVNAISGKINELSGTLIVNSFQHRQFGKDQWINLQKRLQTLITNLKTTHKNVESVNSRIESFA